MRSYSIGGQYEFIINYFFTTSDDYGREKMWLSLSDGESTTRYRVPAYPFQKNLLVGNTIFCKVIDIQENGYPFLIQNKADILKTCYELDNVYWFTVGEKEVDPKSKRPFYRLIDRINGIDWHRYYCSEDTELDGIASFRVVSITDDYISLDLVSDQVGIPDFSTVEESRININPFGHEDIHHEWKSSLVFPSGESSEEFVDTEKQLHVILRCIAGFQNAEGGLLYLGVTNNGEIRGIEKDYPYLNSEEDSFVYSKNPDGYENKIRNAVDRHLGKLSLEHIKVDFYYQTSTRKVFCIVEAQRTPRPIYRDGKEVYKRFGNSFRLLKGEEITNLVYDKQKEVNDQAPFTRPMPSGCAIYNPNLDTELVIPSIEQPRIELNKDYIKKLDFYFMTFFSNNQFMYSKQSHSNDPDCISEVRFNKIDGNLEYSRDLILKCSVDGHAQLIQAYDMCKLGESDTKIGLSTSRLFCAAVAHKYDFLKVSFIKDDEEREKYIRVVSLFGKDTEKTLRANKEPKDIKYQFTLKGISMIPTSCKLKNVEVIHEILPDEIQFVSAKLGANGLGRVIGSNEIDPSTY